ncbi:MAG: L,D-transpeptidase [Hyphomicrobiaceae bacterium]|nr:L,D-transpeptidase [Hyphomicrobiaceae bacterium]
MTLRSFGCAICALFALMSLPAEARPYNSQAYAYAAQPGAGIAHKRSPKRLAKAKKRLPKVPDVMHGGGKPAIAAAAPAVVGFSGYAKGSVVIDTAGRKLYYALGNGRAYAYPVAVGKSGFTWSGTKRISRVAQWPDWRPPAEMRKRKPNLPKLMTGGVNNPLGAKALYLGSSLYRIHGTNDVASIGTAASSGCIRMTNGHVEHLSRIAGVGTTVHVVRRLPGGRVAQRTANDKRG